MLGLLQKFVGNKRGLSLTMKSGTVYASGIIEKIENDVVTFKNGSNNSTFNYIDATEVAGVTLMP